MNALADLQVVRVGEKVSTVPDARGIVGPRRGDHTSARGRDTAADDDSSRAESLHKRKTCRERDIGRGIVSESSARKTSRKGVHGPRRQNMRLLQAEHLAADSQSRCEQWVR